MSDHNSGQNVIKLYSDQTKKSLLECLLQIMATEKDTQEQKAHYNICGLLCHINCIGIMIKIIASPIKVVTTTTTTSNIFVE